MNAPTFKKDPQKTTLFYINMYIIYVFTPNFFAFINSNIIYLCFCHIKSGIEPFVGQLVGGGSFFPCVQRLQKRLNWGLFLLYRSKFCFYMLFRCILTIKSYRYGPNIHSFVFWPTHFQQKKSTFPQIKAQNGQKIDFCRTEGSLSGTISWALGMIWRL